jgi:hypothetical protein
MIQLYPVRIHKLRVMLFWPGRINTFEESCRFKERISGKAEKEPGALKNPRH